jgi:hypothetical protein
LLLLLVVRRLSNLFCSRFKNDISPLFSFKDDSYMLTISVSSSTLLFNVSTWFAHSVFLSSKSFISVLRYSTFSCRNDTAYNISHDRSFRQVKYLDSTNEVVNRLLSLKLIEDIHELSSHGAVRCKLSSRGIYFLIANKMLSYDQIRNLIKNFGDHILFQFFIYPYVTRDTLLKIQDSFIFLRISSYLSECCKKIEDTFDYVRHTFNQKNGQLTQQLFIWDNVPKEDSGTESLRQFLQGMFPWDWLENVEIKKLRMRRV